LKNMNTQKRYRGMAFIVFFLLVFSCLVPLCAYATEKPAIVSYMDGEDQIVLYINHASGKVTTASAKIGQTPCEQVTMKSVLSEDIQVKTLFIIDTSKSIPVAQRKLFVSFLEGMIDEKAENDSFAIATYGKTLTYVCDYTMDRWELIKALESLEFKLQSTYLYDIVEEAVEKINKEKKEEEYHRIILFTDGAENSKNGITKEELYLKLQETPYEIDTIGSKTKDNAAELKELYALSRMTGGSQFAFTKDSDVKAMTAQLGKINDCYQIIAVPDPSFLDGSLRNMTITLNNGATITSDIRMPVISEKLENELKKKEEQEANKKAEEEEAKRQAAELEKKKQEEKERTQLIIVIAAGVCGLAAIVVLIVVAIKLNGSRKTKKDKYADFMLPDDINLDGTQILAAGDESIDLDATQVLVSQMKVHRIRLTDLAEAKNTFEKPLNRPVVVGRSREQSDIVVDYDKSVSGKHCSIEEVREGIFIKDLKSSNHTYLNGTMVTDAVRIKDGDILKVGKTTFKAEIV